MSAKGHNIVLGHWHVPCNLARKYVYVEIATSSASNFKFASHEECSQNEKISYTNRAVVNDRSREVTKLKDLSEIDRVGLLCRSPPPSDGPDSPSKFHRELLGPRAVMDIELRDVF